MAAHNLNSQSSRSHTIFSVWLDTVDAGQALLSFEQKFPACSDCGIDSNSHVLGGAEGVPLASKLNLVDLAGSERFVKTGTQGAMAKEAVQINKSLTFLEQVGPAALSSPPLMFCWTPPSLL